MKLMKVFGIVSILVMAVSLSSCVKNSDDDLDKKWEEWVKEVQTQIKASYGSYEGKLYTMSNDQSTTEDGEVKKDEIDATWMLNNDSTIDLHNVPAALLVKKLPESQNALKEAISNVGNVKIHVQMLYNYYYHSPLHMLVYPQALKFPITYDGGTHQVEVTFYNSEEASGTYAEYMMKDGATYVHKNIIYLFPKELWMDNKLQADFTSAAFLVWLGAKKTLQ